MHKKLYNINVACFCNNNFIQALDELKSFLGFNILINISDNKKLKDSNINAIIVDTENIKKILLNDSKKPKILIQQNNEISKSQSIFSIVYKLPLNVIKFNQDVINICKKFEFKNNSLIFIKDYILDKNERTLRKNNLILKITEKEINFIEILHSSSKPLNRDFILKNIWEYSSETDTHTVETHIYRLRQKIKNQFSDNNFIKNSKNGYSL